MSFRQELRESPATYGLGASWVLVYIIMNFTQGGFSFNEVSLLGFGAVRTATSHDFGSLTWRDFSHGEPWRAVTATFIHFSLAHLLLNLLGLIQLGRMIEEWYGSKQFLAICIVLGGLGNVFGVCTRQVVSQSVAWMLAHGFARVLPPFLKNAAVAGLADNITVAGGSTIILGLMGLGLIVGWRSHTRVGLYLRDQMFGFLAFTAVIGIVSWNVIDNYGHAGGAIAGILVGFAHRFLVRRAEKGWFRTFAFAATIGLIALCAGLQARDTWHDLAEAHRQQVARERQTRIIGLKQLVEQVAILSALFEMLVCERMGPILNGQTPLDPTTLSLPIDFSPILEVPGLVARRSLRPTGPPPQATATLSNRIHEIHKLRLFLDPSGTDMAEEFDTLERVGLELTTGLPSSRDILAFRIARTAILKRTVKTLEALEPESEAAAESTHQPGR